MRSVSGERAQVKAGEREGGSRVMNLALGGWWRLCRRVQLEHLVKLKHLEHPVHLLHLVHHLTVYCKCTLCLLALLSQLCVLLYILRIKQTQTRYIVQCACCVAPHSSVSNLYRNCLDNLANKYSTTLPKIEQKVL